MPNRLIRDGFLDSEAIHQLTDAAECFFHRLMLSADDAGRHDGRVEILRSRLFPLDHSRRAHDVESQLRECIKCQLVIAYEFKSGRYLQIAKWRRCSPCGVSRFPWVDGSHSIEYVKLETRDGVQDFVKTSISHTDGIGHPSGSSPTKTETDTKTGAESDSKAETARPPPKIGEKAIKSDAGYPLPKGEPLPSPLFAKTAHEKRRACDQQIEIIRKMAKDHRVPIMAKTAEGTDVRTGWKLPAEAEVAIQAWENQKVEIERALAG